jgi:hypothetical protein
MSDHIYCDCCGVERATDKLHQDDESVLNLCDACYWTNYHEEEL